MVSLRSRQFGRYAGIPDVFSAAAIRVSMECGGLWWAEKHYRCTTCNAPAFHLEFTVRTGISSDIFKGSFLSKTSLNYILNHTVLYHHFKSKVTIKLFIWNELVSNISDKSLVNTFKNIFSTINPKIERR